MAKTGPKPKPAHLRLVDGTHRTTRHGSSAKAREQVEASAQAFGKLTKPPFVKGEEAKAWKRYITPATWLDGSREPLAVLFCELWAEHTYNPKGFPASKVSQMRACMSELGLTDERNRGDVDDKDKDEFFD